MTAETTRHRTVQFICDECGTALDTEKFTFRDGLDLAKAQGWLALKDCDEWQHRCEDCA